MSEKLHHLAYLKYEDLTQDKQQVNANFRGFIKLTERPYGRKKSVLSAGLDIQSICVKNRPI